MWGLAAAAYWQVLLTVKESSAGTGPLYLQAVKRSFQNLWANKYLAAMTLLLLVPAVSLFWSDDVIYWLRVTRVRLPFLVLPWAFANLPTLSARQYREVLYLLLWLMVLLCIGVGINFLLHYDAVMTGLGRGQPVPVPRQHVRFSLVVATAIISGAWLWREGFYLKYQQEKKATLAAVLFLFVFLHILSVRGGLAVMYVAILAAIFWYVWHTKKWATGLAVLVLIAGGLALAAETIPSLRQRIAYMKYDWERYKANEGEAYSDASRWVSLKVGYRLWQNAPFLGTGSGDLENEVKRETKEQFPNYSLAPKLPHNQWLHIMSSTGLLGLILSLIAFFAPILATPNRNQLLFWIFQAMVFATFIIECTIENAIGVAWYLFYTLWLIRIKFSLNTDSHGI
jgi:O-antigen ligase